MLAEIEVTLSQNPAAFSVPIETYVEDVLIQHQINATKERNHSRIETA